MFLQMSEGFQWIKQTPGWKENRCYQMNLKKKYVKKIKLNKKNPSQKTQKSTKRGMLRVENGL